ncbi:UNVERIFIED_CONTAM: DNA-(apurinic or apyrimidinic site) lyase 2 [Sesamum angustifolium]|uniref:DNA-(apurinic or apyrimidinic site) endonuclease 2 n=1 Tax=Sesamum angustifolium TaxID=2727405 RepID=A0AAW2J6D3_9LAMI
MKIVTYNVNGLRPRVSQFGSLRKLLDALDADIICFQETKLSRQELRADLVQAEGYESFFSCTRTSDKGRTGYSGVATFCRIKSAFASDEVALPVSAEEGFTGVLKISPGFGSRKSEYSSVVEGLEDFSTDELLKIDGEGRCIITDHEHFVLFNVYGPRAQCDDTERIQFKHKFFNILQKRWESLLGQGRRIFVVGDLNIAPSAIDRCDAGPDFEQNEREAYTCWPTNSGAVEFNFGTRIDHILSAGPCLHKEENLGCNIVTCHVKECDILEQFKRWKPGDTPRHKDINGRAVKLEGSDHVPVYASLVEIPNIQQHNTPSLSTRYCPQVYGCQRTLVYVGIHLKGKVVQEYAAKAIMWQKSDISLMLKSSYYLSMFARRQPAEETSLSGGSNSISEDSIVLERCSQLVKRPLDACSPSEVIHQGVLCTSDASFGGEHKETSSDSPCSQIGRSKTFSSVVCKKKARQCQSSQLSVKSFFKKTVDVSGDPNSSSADTKVSQVDISFPYSGVNETSTDGGEHDSTEWPAEQSLSMQEDTSQPSENDKSNVALVEWQRIQQLMQTSIPLCKGHKEPCVSRVVKKSGPNLGRRFYVCARAEVFEALNALFLVVLHSC